MVQRQRGHQRLLPKDFCRGKLRFKHLQKVSHLIIDGEAVINVKSFMTGPRHIMEFVVDECIRIHIEKFLNNLTSKRSLQPDWLREALFRVPRHCFIEQYCDQEAQGGIVQVGSPEPTSEQLETIYSDRGLMIREDPHSAASQPGLIFEMLDDLELTHGLKVLEVGTGSGWNAGLIAFGVGDDSLVYSVDLQVDLVERAREHLNAVGYKNVNLMTGDGGHGWHGETFDRIVVTVGSPDIPPAWVESLADDGILVMPLKIQGVGDPILRLHRQGSRFVGGITQWAGFMNLQGDFYSPVEDWLNPPWDPVVEQLLKKVPEQVLLPDAFTVDCAFWLHLNGRPMQILGEYKGKPGLHSVLLDRELPALYVPEHVPHPEKHMDVYGNRDLVGTFVKGIVEWSNLGKPKMTDYHVELSAHGELVDAPYMWFDQRPNAALRFILRE